MKLHRHAIYGTKASHLGQGLLFSSHRTGELCPALLLCKLFEELSRALLLSRCPPRLREAVMIQGSNFGRGFSTGTTSDES
jgi:hypothetical protein